MPWHKPFFTERLKGICEPLGRGSEHTTSVTYITAFFKKTRLLHKSMRSSLHRYQPRILTSCTAAQHLVVELSMHMLYNIFSRSYFWSEESLGLGNGHTKSSHFNKSNTQKCTALLKYRRLKCSAVYCAGTRSQT